MSSSTNNTLDVGSVCAARGRPGKGVWVQVEVRWLPGVRVLAVPALPLPRPLAVRHLSWFHRSLVGQRETRESHGQGRDVFVQGSCGGRGGGEVRRPFPESSVSSLTSLAQVLPLQPSTDRKEGVSPVPGRPLVGERVCGRRQPVSRRRVDLGDHDQLFRSCQKSV